jgi:NAD-dependent deacetylase
MNIVILTGAGISAEIGLGTFRDKDGLWTRYRIEDVATPEAYARNPALVHEFYNLRRRGLRAAELNVAHFALAELERQASGRLPAGHPKR